MKSLKIHKFNTNVPQCIGDFTAQHLIALGMVYSKNLNRAQARVWLASIWCDRVWMYNQKLIKGYDKLIRIARKKNLDYSHLQKLQELRDECEFNASAMANLCDWYESAEHYTDRWILDKITIRSFLILKHTVEGPSFRFGNIKFWEWCKAETFFSRFQDTNNPSDFLKFMACLYHPVKSGKRIPFDDEYELHINSYASQLKNLAPEYMSAIILNYVAFKRWLKDKYPDVFGNKEFREDGEDAVKQDYAELLLRAAKSQHLDEEIVKNKSLLVELKKLDIAAKDYAVAKQKTLNQTQI